MLILSRRLDESLIIDGNIEIVVTGISGTKVSLGVIAPPKVSVYRKELCSGSEEKQNQKRIPKSVSSKSAWKVLGNMQSLRYTDSQ